MPHFDEKLLADHYVVDISNNLPLINTVNQYIKMHPEFYKLDVNYRLVIAEVDPADTTPLENRIVYTIYDEPVRFNDTIHQIPGWIITDYKVTTLPSGKTQCDYVFKIWITKSVKLSKQYHILLQEYMHKQARHGDRITLNYYKILNEQLITHTFYDRPLSDWLTDVDQLKAEFFSPHKKYLFDVMTKVNRNGNWSNLILHGEPGTGKSSFVYRLATRLKMSIISVDLSMYIDRKRDLYSIFHGNEFSLPYGKGQKLTVSQNCIIILEEFDSAIEKIKQLENIFLFKSDTIHTYVENKTSEIGQKVQNAAVPPALQMDIPLSDPYQYLASKQNAGNPEAVDPLKITNEIFDIVRTITEDNKSDVLRLRDMLELFQGPVPVRDRIIVATTNNYEQIKNIIPALFRPGRLTPIKFTYLDADSFSELCMYYFKKMPTALQIPEFQIPTSQITELAIKYTSMAEAKKVAPSTQLHSFLQELAALNEAAHRSILLSPVKQPLVADNSISANKNNQIKILKRPTSQQLPPIDTQQNNTATESRKVAMYSDWIDKKLESINELEASTFNQTTLPPNTVTAQLQEPEVSLVCTSGGSTDVNLKKKIKSRFPKNHNASSNIPAVSSRIPEISRQHIRPSLAQTSTQYALPNQSSEDDQIRNTVVEKVLANEKALRKKNPNYNPDELLHSYMTTAIAAPQHDDEY